MAPDERQWTLDGRADHGRAIDHPYGRAPSDFEASGPPVRVGETVTVVPRGSELDRAIRALRERAKLERGGLSPYSSFTVAADFLERLQDGGKER